MKFQVFDGRGFRHALSTRSSIGAALACAAVLACSSGVAAQSLSSRNAAVQAGANAAAVAGQGGQAVLPPEAAAALQRQLSLQARNALAIDAMRAAQAAARNLAIKDPANNLFDAAGKPLNGLGAGALDAAVTADAIAKGLTKQDKAPDQRQVWDGGLAPIQTVRKDADSTDKFDVTVKQTQATAIFSWKTFNVGKDTELLFDQMGNKGWVALNRVVGGLDANGRRENGGPVPSQILGKIKADGTVLVLNQNGVIFSGSSQVNVNTLIATTAEIGSATNFGPQGDPSTATTFLDRNRNYLRNGLTGQRGTINDTAQFPRTSLFNEFSPYAGDTLAQPLEGVKVRAGAIVDAGVGGSIILNSFEVENAGTITARQGNVSLVSSFGLKLAPYTGTGESPGKGLSAFINPNIRGIVGLPAQLGSVSNADTIPSATLAELQTRSFYSRNLGLISAPEGSVFAVENGSAAAAAAALPTSVRSLLDYSYTGANGRSISTSVGGVLSATTSVDHNGYIQVDRTLDNSIVSIIPDASGKTITLDPSSLANFKRSFVRIGYLIGEDALVLAPGGTLNLGDVSSIGLVGNRFSNVSNRILIETGASIDVSGLKNVLLPASRNELTIFLKGNELADSGGYQDSFLNGKTVYLDARLSGVRFDGQTWIGSPLINAKAIGEQIPIGINELLTRSGDVTIAGLPAYSIGGGTGTQIVDSTGRVIAGPTLNGQTPDTIVTKGAAVDVSGGWVSYTPGIVRSTQLLSSDGRIIDISKADPTQVRLVGFAGDFVVDHRRWGVTERYSSLGIRGGIASRDTAGYIEGRDAGAFTLAGSINVLDGMVYGQAFAGDRQRSDAQTGTATSAIDWDKRALQAATS